MVLATTTVNKRKRKLFHNNLKKFEEPKGRSVQIMNAEFRLQSPSQTTSYEKRKCYYSYFDYSLRPSFTLL